MPLPLALHPASPRDLDQIMALEAAGFDPGHREARATYERRIAAFPEGSLLAYLGEACIGCVFTEIWPASSVPPAEHFALGHDILERHDPQHGSELYLSSMTIAPAFRGRGLGMPLFAGCLERLAGAFPQLASVLLLVNETWHGARRIYRAAGFVEIARFPGFFTPAAAPRQGALVMRRKLRQS